MIPSLKMRIKASQSGVSRQYFGSPSSARKGIFVCVFSLLQFGTVLVCSELSFDPSIFHPLE